MNEIALNIQEATAQLTSAGAPWELITKNIGGIDYKLYKQAPSSMKELLDAGRQHGDAEFIKFEQESWSFNRFFRDVDAISYQLKHLLKVEKGQRIAIAMRNYPEWMSIYSAIVSLGAIAVPLNSWGKSDELEYGLSDSGATIVFCDQARYQLISQYVTEHGLNTIVARSDINEKITNKRNTTSPLLTSYDAFIEDGLDKAPEPFEVDPEDPVQIMYTSGTTGNPKGALSSHRNICQAIINFEYHATCSAMTNMESITLMLESGNAPTSLLAVPLFHVSGLYAQFILSLRSARKLVMMYKWDVEQALKLIESEKITILTAAPSMLLDLFEHPKWQHTDTSSLFSLGAGGSATPPKLNQLIKNGVENAYVGAGFGSTETNASGASCTGNAFEYKSASAGTLSPYMEFKTVDSEGNNLAKGQQGEIYLRGPSIINAYWNKPEANKNTFKDGWYATGDIGYIDDENFVFLVDRVKDMIIRGGENIYCFEIEALISSHPCVQEIAAFGVPHSNLGEELAVAVFLQNGKTLSEKELQDWVKERLAGFKVPSYVWIYAKPLPRNAAGKVIKPQLKKAYLEQQA